MIHAIYLLIGAWVGCCAGVLLTCMAASGAIADARLQGLRRGADCSPACDRCPENPKNYEEWAA